ncbi:MAG: hypothetical protein PHI31_15175 [Desulfuromonadaceae bacterium]|nr:hypothetical protein [Desulfuromonadaceae bacterium]
MFPFLPRWKLYGEDEIKTVTDHSVERFTMLQAGPRAAMAAAGALRPCAVPPHADKEPSVWGNDLYGMRSGVS